MNLLKHADVRTFDRILAEQVGLNESIFLGQLHFWIERGHPERHEDRQWIRKSAKQFTDKDFPWWSTKTVERIISRLQTAGIILSRPGTITDQRKFYTIVYDHRDLQVPTDKLSVPHRQNVIGPTDKLSVLLIEDQEDQGKGSTPKVDDVELPPAGFDRETEINLVRKNPTHGPTLARFWRRCMSEYGHTSATQPGMKIKDQKMLKDMLKLLPEGGERMLLNVLEHYALFVNFAREGYNVNLAARPQVQKLMLVVEGIAEFDTPAMADDTDYSNLGLKGLLDGDDNDSDSNADDA